MRLVNRVSMILLAGGALGLAACGGGDDDGGNGGGMTVDPAGTHNGYVLSSLTVPATNAQATAVAVDVDDDGRVENALGNLLATLATFDLDIQTAVDEQIVTGGVIILADVQATDLSQANGVGLQVFLGGSPNPMPCADDADTVCGGHLEGGASFSVTEDYDALVVGSIVGGQFTGGPGEVTIELALAEGSSVPVRLVGARVEMGVTADALTSGKMGGAIRSEDVDNDLIPAVATLMNNIIAECEPPGGDLCCPQDSAGEQVLMLFNSEGNGGDCEITVAELLEDDLIDGTIRNPDLDLFDADGNFNPNDDGEKDSISLGVGFSAVAADFTAP